MSNVKTSLDKKKQPSCLGAVMGSILKELEERKQWAENGMMAYSDDTGMRLEYQARIEEIENAILVVNQYCP